MVQRRESGGRGGWAEIARRADCLLEQRWAGETSWSRWGDHCSPSLSFSCSLTVGSEKIIVREGFKNPRHGNFPLGGYPPPAPGASTDEIFPKS